MTLRLAGFQHFCGQLMRAGGAWADAFLTGLSPLTYERGDWLADKEAEEEVAEPQCNCTSFGDDPTFDAKYCALHGEGVSSDWLFEGERFKGDKDIACSNCPTAFTLDDLDQGGCLLRCTTTERVIDPSHTQPHGSPPAVGGEGPTGVCDIPPSPPVGCPNGTIRTLPNAVAVRVPGGWSVVWHAWPPGTVESKKSWVYLDGSPTAQNIESWPEGPAPQLPKFEFADLQAIASDYLVHHFPWPDGDGKFGCTCGTKGFTITTWTAHVGELQISELVFYLTGLLYDQQQ